MSRRNPKDLFQLIKSLTPSEKRYIKKFASRHTIGKINKTVLLFDIIDKQKDYDNEGLLEKATFTNKKLLPELKKHLYQLILRALRSYHDDSTGIQEVRTLFHELEILYNKGLLSQSEKVLDRLEEKCTELEYFPELLNILYWRIKMTSAVSYEDVNEKDLADLESQIQTILKKVNVLSQYYTFSVKFFHRATATIGKSYIRTADKLKELDALVENSLVLKNEDYANSILATYFYHNTLGAYYGISNKVEKGYFHFKSLVNTLEQHVIWKKEYGYVYYNIVRNLALSCMQLHKYNEVSELLEKIQSIPFATIQAKTQAKIDAYNLKLELFICTGKFNEALLLIPEIVEFSDNSQSHIRKIDNYISYFYISIVYLSTSNYKTASHWLNKILNLQDKSIIIDIYSFSLILQLIIHYELKHYDLLSYIIRNTSRFLLSEKRLFEFEKTVLKFFKKFSSVSQKKNLNILYEEFRKEIISIDNTPYKRKEVEFFDLVSWLDSKIENRPFEEIVKEKAEALSRLS